MDRSAKERLIAKICWGKVLVHVPSLQFPLALHPPSPVDLATAAIAYDDAIAEANSNGMMDEQERLSDLNQRRIWTVDDDNRIMVAKSDLGKLRRGILDYLYQRQRLEQVRSAIRKAEETLCSMLHRKYSLLVDTAEAFASSAQQKRLISLITELPDGTPLWPTYHAFQEYDDVTLIRLLCTVYFERSVLPDSAVRELARTDPWRPRWSIATSLGISPFGNPMDCWSANQRSLAYWSKVYDNVYEAYERPQSEVIDDDDLLDSWFLRQSDQSEQRAKKAAGEKASETPNHSGCNEVFIKADPGGAGLVYDMNDPTGRRQLKARQQMMQKHGVVKEQDMPDSQKTMRQQLAEMGTQRMQTISRR